MPQKAKSLFLEAFDKQAANVLATLNGTELEFSTISIKTGLPSASVFRIHRRLKEA